MKHLLIPALAALALLAPGRAPAAEDSNFGCRNLEQSQQLPAIEGANGVFYRKLTDLRMNNAMSPRIIDQLARFAKTLEAQGTTLIFVPPPPRSLAMPEALPPRARDLGFDPEMARAVYEDTIQRLRDAGINAVDVLAALDKKPDDAGPVYYGTDIHWTPLGARLTARAVADKIAEQASYADLDKTEYKTESHGRKELFSTMRIELQAFCKLSLPRPVAEIFETNPVESAISGGGSIFASDEGAPEIALTGTSMSEKVQFNFAGFLSQFSKLDVRNHSIAGGNQYGAISSYLMSDSFAEERPAFLVWENPIYNNLGEFGRVPIRELTTAAGKTCQKPLKAEKVDARTLRATVEPGLLSPEDMILARSDGETRRAQFSFSDDSGLTRRAVIERQVRAKATPRFYQYLKSHWLDGITEISVEFDRPVGPDADIVLCSNQEEIQG